MSEMIRARFGFDEGPMFAGWHNPTDRWNGWANPHLPKDELLRFLTWIVSEEQGGGFWTEGKSGEFLLWFAGQTGEDEASEFWPIDPDRYPTAMVDNEEILYEAGCGLCWWSEGEDEDLVARATDATYTSLAEMLHDGTLPLNFHRDADSDEAGPQWSQNAWGHLHDFCDANMISDTDAIADLVGLDRACDILNIVTGHLGPLLVRGAHLCRVIWDRVESEQGEPFVKPDAFGIEMQGGDGKWRLIGQKYDTGDAAWNAMRREFFHVPDLLVRIVALPLDSLEFQPGHCDRCGGFYWFKAQGDCTGCGPGYEYGEQDEGYLARSAPE